MNLDSMLFMLEIICLKNKGWGLYYKSNLDGYADAGAHWIALYCKNIEIIYLDSFWVEHDPKKI